MTPLDLSINLRTARTHMHALIAASNNNAWEWKVRGRFIGFRLEIWRML